MFLEISSTSITHCVSQDLFSLKLCCSSNNMLELAKCLVKFDVTIVTLVNVYVDLLVFTRIAGTL